LKRSSHIDLKIVGLLGLALAPAVAACTDAQNQPMHCVDANYVVVDERNCENPTYYGGSYLPFYWYYGGPRSLPIGQRAYDGSFTPSAGSSYVAPHGATYSAGSGTVHGGFGSTAMGGSAGGGADNDGHVGGGGG
jgi:hypothetical protein